MCVAQYIGFTSAQLTPLSSRVAFFDKPTYIAVLYPHLSSSFHGGAPCRVVKLNCSRHVCKIIGQEIPGKGWSTTLAGQHTVRGGAGICIWLFRSVSMRTIKTAYNVWLRVVGCLTTEYLHDRWSRCVLTLTVTPSLLGPPLTSNLKSNFISMYFPTAIILFASD